MPLFLVVPRQIRGIREKFVILASIELSESRVVVIKGDTCRNLQMICDNTSRPSEAVIQ